MAQGPPIFKASTSADDCEWPCSRAASRRIENSEGGRTTPPLCFFVALRFRRAPRRHGGQAPRPSPNREPVVSIKRLRGRKEGEVQGGGVDVPYKVRSGSQRRRRVEANGSRSSPPEITR